MAAQGSYDSFNRYAQRGDMAPASSSFYDTLMTASADEVEVYYGLIAEKVEYSPEYDWIVFHLRPEARFQDGAPITAEAVVFTFNKFLEEGVPQFAEYYKPVTAVEALDDRRVKFTLSEGDKEMLVSLGGLTILPPQFWSDKDLSEPLSEPPLGSGAYTVTDYALGQYVVYERLEDYWGRDLPVNRGQLNVDEVRYEMYRDGSVMLEALKAGEIDLRIENVSKQWATQYEGTNFDAGYIIKEEIPDESPPTIQEFVFNVQREVFADRRVRQAIAYALDFEWMNKNLFYGQYSRMRSYFSNTAYEALGLPDEDELAVLEPIRDLVPPEVFSEEYNPPVTDGSGNIRPQIIKAKELLNEAGWEVRDQVMTNVETGEPLEFELMIRSPTTERVAIPFQENLKKMGITMNIRLVDSAQYAHRYWDRDYDMVWGVDSGRLFPDSNLQLALHSDYIDSTYNTPGVDDPAVDYLVDGIMERQDDNRALIPWGRALDRVLQWNGYGVLLWNSGIYRVAYWDKFDRPDIKPTYDLGIGTWWVDEEKAAALPRRNAG